MLRRIANLTVFLFVLVALNKGVSAEEVKNLPHNQQKVHELILALEKLDKDKNEKEVVRMLTEQQTLLSETEDGILTAIGYAAKYNARERLEYFLYFPHPSQIVCNRIMKAFSSAASEGKISLMEWLLSKPKGLPLPGRYAVYLAFRGAAQNGR